MDDRYSAPVIARLATQGCVQRMPSAKLTLFIRRDLLPPALRAPG